MPRVINHDDRRRDIARAALRLLARQGPAGLTIRAVARELGGSLTVVTHYYDSRQALLADLVEQLSQGWHVELGDLQRAGDEPLERLRTMLEWLLPLNEDARLEERARFALLAAHDDPVYVNMLRGFDRYIRDELRAYVAGVVPADRVDSSVDLLRAFTNGVVLDTVIDPQAWPASRQLRLLDELIRLVAAEVPIA